MPQVIPGKQNLVMYRYAHFLIEGTYTDDADAPIDTTGFKGVFEMRKNYDDDTAAFIATSEGMSAPITFGGEDGSFAIEVSPTETGEITVGEYYYTVAFKDTDDIQSPYMEGVIDVRNNAAKTIIDW